MSATRKVSFGLDAGFSVLKAEIIARTGHHYYLDKDALLFDRLVRRFKVCGLPDSTAYLARLSSPDGAVEWAALEAEITIGETFFFRYAEQFQALRTTILPGLIAARVGQRILRIWSAGCSTGAEPYSIAILVHELLGAALPDWRVSIVGTDISTEALATARAARYGRWALRTLPPEERLRWFLPLPAGPGALREGGFALRPEYRRMVRFAQGNLLGLIDGSEPIDGADYDLILCRNVLIYFSHEHVLGIVRALGNRLAPEGWLLLGHAEPNPAFAGWITPVSLPGTVAYRRPDPAGPLEVSPDPPPGVVAPRDPVDSPPPIAEGPPPPEPNPLPALAEATGTPDPEDALARIRHLADTGQTGEAWRTLREALTVTPTDARLRYYEGLLARSLGWEREAERALRGALFLDRDFVMAHFQLGLLLSALDRAAPATRALDNAGRLAHSLAPDTVLPEGDGVTAVEMVETVRRMFASRPERVS